MEVIDKKYQVFVSSTYKDLNEERQEAIFALLRMGHIPVGMEVFHAADEETFEYIKKLIAQCDYFILILGGEYGTKAKDGKSFTEKEYHYAREINKPIIAFYPDSKNKKPSKEQKNFIDFVKSDISPLPWETKDKLATSITTSLPNIIKEKPSPGWIKINDADLEDRVYTLIRNHNKRRMFGGQDMKPYGHDFTNIWDGVWEGDAKEIPNANNISTDDFAVEFHDFKIDTVREGIAEIEGNITFSKNGKSYDGKFKGRGVSGEPTGYLRIGYKVEAKEGTPTTLAKGVGIFEADALSNNINGFFYSLRGPRPNQIASLMVELRREET